MKYRLFIDMGVLEFLGALRKKDRQFLIARFYEICASPSSHRDFRNTDETGRILDGHVAGLFAITYWEDFGDRHLRIMEVDWADKKL